MDAYERFFSSVWQNPLPLTLKPIHSLHFMMMVFSLIFLDVWFISHAHSVLCLQCLRTDNKHKMFRTIKFELFKHNFKWRILYFAIKKKHSGLDRFFSSPLQKSVISARSQRKYQAYNFFYNQMPFVLTRTRIIIIKFAMCVY